MNRLYVYSLSQPGTVPLYQYANFVNPGYYYSTTNTPTTSTWRNDGVVAWVYPISGGPTGTVPLYQYTNRLGPGYQYRITNTPTDSTWLNYGIVAYVYPSMNYITEPYTTRSANSDYPSGIETFNDFNGGCWEGLHVVNDTAIKITVSMS